MKKLTITWLGQPKDVQTKFGLKTKNSIKAQEHGDAYLSFWVNSATKDWKIGDTIEVEDVSPREYQGKTYWDIKMPKTSGGVPPEVLGYLERINSGVVKLNLGIAELLEAKRKDEKIKIAGTDIDYPTPEEAGVEMPEDDNEISF